MEIYILRHGEAEMRETGHSDGERKLTVYGKRDLKAVLKVAHKLGVAPQVILTSPLRRAQETAKIGAEILHSKHVVETKVWCRMRARKWCGKKSARCRRWTVFDRGPQSASGESDGDAARSGLDGGSQERRAGPHHHAIQTGASARRIEMDDYAQGCESVVTGPVG